MEGAHQVPETIHKLTDKYEFHQAAYKKGKYNETQLRREFIDPFFKTLGWDVDNTRGYSELYKEVIHEDPIRIRGSTEFIDYAFRIGGSRKFIVEAKKPAVNIRDDPGPALQIRRYAWNARLPLSILTDFEEFAVYDCTKKPMPGDSAATARIAYFTFKEYPEKWSWIADIFSQERILQGSFDKFAAGTKGKKGTATVDEAILADIEEWRDVLAKNIALRNANLSVDELNVAVQKTIDRILFLRICEDRGIEEYGCLRKLLEGQDVYQRLVALFHRADTRYNSGLFHFNEEAGWEEMPDRLTPDLAIDDAVLKKIIKRLYYPESPYEFSVISPVILGQVYEQFLGKVIRLTPGHQAKVEYKPEVKKAGGVYYTPQYIVDYIVSHTVGELVKDKTPREVANLRVLDPACGSGSFLLGAYQFLLDWHLTWYIHNLVPVIADKSATSPEVQVLLPESAPKTGKKKFTGDTSLPIYKSANGSSSRVRSDWKLTIAERKRILLNNIYGVDIDTQAVEVTKLSLLLKVLEEESQENVSKQLKLFDERALPSLHQNIKCGNSLIGTDIYADMQATLDDLEAVKRINAFDWDRAFPEIMQRGGFDAVIGNPPYGADLTVNGINYIKSKFITSGWRGESYLLFIEKGLNLLVKNGLFGFIIPDTYLNLGFTKSLRDYILQNSAIQQIVSLPSNVFQTAIVDTTLFFTKKLEKSIDFHESTAIIKIFDKKSKIENIENPKREFCISTEEWYKNNSFLIQSDKTEIDLITKIQKNNKKFSDIVDIFYGIKAYQVGKGKPPQTEKIRDEKPFTSESRNNENFLPFFDGKDIGRYQIFWNKNNWINYGKWLAEPRNPEKFNGEKILIRKIVGKTIISTYTSENSYCNTLLYVMKIVEGANYSYKFILGILNSKFIGWLFRKKFQISDSDTFPQIMIHDIFELPLCESNNARHDKMVALVERMLALHKKRAEVKTDHEKNLIEGQIDATDKQIDALVYELYGLTEEEIKIVEGEGK